MPTRDTRALTLRCLNALEAASGPGLEVLVVDDASRDGTAAAVAELGPAVKLIQSADPRGYTASVNAGLRRAEGELLLLLNSDTEVAGDALEALVAGFTVQPELGALGAQLYDPDGSPQWSGGREPTLAWLFALATGLPPRLRRLRAYRRLRPLAPAGHRPVEWVSGAAMALRRQAWEAIGELDETFLFYCQDLDFCSRLRREGWSVAIDPAVRVIHHHGATISQRRGTVDSKQLPLLWTDLLRWASKHRRPGWVKTARWALRAGSRLRLAGRTLLAPGSRGRHEVWQRETAVIRDGLRSL